jgi:hypothetical protein
MIKHLKFQTNKRIDGWNFLERGQNINLFMFWVCLFITKIYHENHYDYFKKMWNGERN